MTDHDEREGYDGEVTVGSDGEPPRTARAALAARFDPLAGRVVWSGRAESLNLAAAAAICLYATQLTDWTRPARP